MNFLYYLSDGIIPFIFIIIVGYGLLNRINIFDVFVEGAVDGFKTVYKILPTLIGLMAMVGILRISGSLDYLVSLIKPISRITGFPSELLPLTVIKMFSSSAATSLLIDIYKQYGPDSYIGTLASVIMSCSETVFYTMSIYFVTAKVTKTRYTLLGALFATIAGIAASLAIVRIHYKL